MNLEGRAAMITGAGGGIARATARALAEQGADIVAVELDDAAARETAAAVESEGRRALVAVADVTVKAQVERAVAAGRDAFGDIDVLINAVGIGGTATVADHPEELWDRILAVNLKSAFLCSQAVLPAMTGTGWGRIVNVTSRAAHTSGAMTAAYAASKGGLLAFSRVLAIEAGEHGITVNNVAPGTTVTPMVENFYGGPEAQAEEAVRSGVLLHPQRLAMPEEIAGAIAYLCGPLSDHITGTTLHVNGGSYTP